MNNKVTETKKIREMNATELEALAAELAKKMWLHFTPELDEQIYQVEKCYKEITGKELAVRHVIPITC